MHYINYNLTVKCYQLISLQQDWFIKAEHKENIEWQVFEDNVFSKVTKSSGMTWLRYSPASTDKRSETSSACIKGHMS